MGGGGGGGSSAFDLGAKNAKIVSFPLGVHSPVAVDLELLILAETTQHVTNTAYILRPNRTQAAFAIGILVRNEASTAPSFSPGVSNVRRERAQTVVDSRENGETRHFFQAVGQARLPGDLQGWNRGAWK